ncbi:MAG TPA: AraC family transcriptional regulator, partial [Verrucomicrobiae bacterium]|nr:AraC family transcriptional regulator [Verrucomicrobiae bacterium]
LPPNRAIWIPAGVRHQTLCRGEVRFLALYVDATLDRQPGVTRVFEVSPLVRALIDEMALSTEKRAFGAREAAMSKLLLDEIDRMPRLPATTNFPTDNRLRRVCDAILADPADNRPIDEWADVAGMGRRTFTRAFRLETGMSLVTWRRQVRLTEAASRIAAGQTINAVAYEVGYESSSAFIAMFHREFGAPPGAYCRR